MNTRAINVAQKTQRTDSPCARRLVTTALKELPSKKIQKRL